MVLIVGPAFDFSITLAPKMYILSSVGSLLSKRFRSQRGMKKFSQEDVSEITRYKLSRRQQIYVMSSTFCVVHIGHMSM